MTSCSHNPHPSSTEANNTAGVASDDDPITPLCWPQLSQTSNALHEKPPNADSDTIDIDFLESIILAHEPASVTHPNRYKQHMTSIGCTIVVCTLCAPLCVCCCFGIALGMIIPKLYRRPQMSLAAEDEMIISSDKTAATPGVVENMTRHTSTID